MSEPILATKDLRKTFGLTEAIRGVNVEVGRGEVVAVVGPSGSGKSTLLHLLAGVIAPDAGDVVFEGQVISALSETDRSALRLHRFGFVFQFGQLLTELSARDNVTIPLLLTGVRRRAAAAQADTWLQRLGLAGCEDKLPSQLSGGQAQRVAIARALVTGPQVLFADEPTGALDSLAAEKVMNALTEQASSTGTTVVLITHDPRTAAYADRQIVMRDGQARSIGSAPDGE